MQRWQFCTAYYFDYHELHQYFIKNQILFCNTGIHYLDANELELNVCLLSFSDGLLEPVTNLAVQQLKTPDFAPAENFFYVRCAFNTTILHVIGRNMNSSSQFIIATFWTEIWAYFSFIEWLPHIPKRIAERFQGTVNMTRNSTSCTCRVKDSREVNSFGLYKTTSCSGYIEKQYN